MKIKEFDYNIYIDYSENLLGYLIIEKKNLKEILQRISRFKHYKNARNRKFYLKNVKKTIKEKDILEFIYKLKIRELRFTLEIYTDIAEFLGKHRRDLVFISVDDSQYHTFKKLVRVIDGENVSIKKESELRRGTLEYQMSLLLDNILNIERLKR